MSEVLAETQVDDAVAEQNKNISMTRVHLRYTINIHPWAKEITPISQSNSTFEDESNRLIKSDNERPKLKLNPIAEDFSCSIAPIILNKYLLTNKIPNPKISEYISKYYIPKKNIKYLYAFLIK